MGLLKKVLFAKIRFRKDAAHGIYITDILAILIWIVTLVCYPGVSKFPIEVKWWLAAGVAELLPLFEIVPKFFDPAVIQDEREYARCKQQLVCRLTGAAVVAVMLLQWGNHYRIASKSGFLD